GEASGAFSLVVEVPEADDDSAVRRHDAVHAHGGVAEIVDAPVGDVNVVLLRTRAAALIGRDVYAPLAVIFGGGSDRRMRGKRAHRRGQNSPKRMSLHSAQP